MRILLFLALSVFLFAPAVSSAQNGTLSEKGESSSIKKGGLEVEMLEDIKKRNEELDAREKELDERKTKLDTIEKDIEKQLSELKLLKAKIDESIKLRQDIKEEAIVKLAKTYASMPPETSAKLVEGMDERIAIRVLSAMKERAAGKILAAMSPKAAGKLSEGLVLKK